MTMGVVAATATDAMGADGAIQKQTQVSKKSFHFLAGLGSGLFTAVLLQPADLLKTRVQQRISSPSQYPATLTSNLTPASSSTASTRSTHPILATLREILASPNPIKSLWRGTVPSAVRTGAGSALYFGGLNMLRAKMAENGWGTEASKSQVVSASRIATDSQSPFTSTAGTPSQHTSTTPSPTPIPSSTSSSLPKLSHTANLLTGAVARAGAGLALMPVTVIKVRFESSLYNYTSLLSASTDIFRKEGLRGFFAGFGATAVRDAPYAGLYVFFYEYSKAKLNAMSSAATPATSLNPHTSTSSAATINFTSGMLAATFATAATNPFDAIKTRLQLEPAKYRNMLFAGQKMVREEGVRCLMDGLALRMGRKAISSALAWTAYEEIIRRAERRFVETKI